MSHVYINHIRAGRMAEIAKGPGPSVAVDQHHAWRVQKYYDLLNEEHADLIRAGLVPSAVVPA